MSLYRREAPIRPYFCGLSMLSMCSMLCHFLNFSLSFCAPHFNSFSLLEAHFLSGFSSVTPFSEVKLWGCALKRFCGGQQPNNQVPILSISTRTVLDLPETRGIGRELSIIIDCFSAHFQFFSLKRGVDIRKGQVASPAAFVGAFPRAHRSLKPCMKQCTAGKTEADMDKRCYLIGILNGYLNNHKHTGLA